MKYKLIVILILLANTPAFCQQTILWEISDSMTHSVSYILGTFHQFGNSFVDSIPEIKESLLKTQIAIFESIEDTEETRAFIESRVASDEIKKNIKKKDLRKLKLLSQEWGVDIYKLKPLEISIKLQQEFLKIKCNTTVSTDRWTHFDDYMIHLAEENGIEIMGLETSSLQLSFLNHEMGHPNWKDERKRISFWLSQIERENIDEVHCLSANKYRVFDIRYQFQEECENDILNQKRNENWLEMLPTLMREKNCFIAVGYIHLKRKCGLLESLKKEGFTVQPVDLEKTVE